jgi:chromosome segregation ATPase
MRPDKETIIRAMNELEAKLKGREIELEIFKEENEELRKQIKDLQDKLYKAERSGPIWEQHPW